MASVNPKLMWLGACSPSIRNAGSKPNGSINKGLVGLVQPDDWYVIPDEGELDLWPTIHLSTLTTAPQSLASDSVDSVTMWLGNTELAAETTGELHTRWNKEDVFSIWNYADSEESLETAFDNKAEMLFGLQGQIADEEFPLTVNARIGSWSGLTPPIEVELLGWDSLPLPRTITSPLFLGYYYMVRMRAKYPVTELLGKSAHTLIIELTAATGKKLKLTRSINAVLCLKDKRITPHGVMTNDADTVSALMPYPAERDPAFPLSGFYEISSSGSRMTDAPYPRSYVSNNTDVHESIRGEFTPPSINYTTYIDLYPDKNIFTDAISTATVKKWSELKDLALVRFVPGAVIYKDAQLERYDNGVEFYDEGLYYFNGYDGHRLSHTYSKLIAEDEEAGTKEYVVFASFMFNIYSRKTRWGEVTEDGPARAAGVQHYIQIGETGEVVKLSNFAIATFPCTVIQAKIDPKHPDFPNPSGGTSGVSRMWVEGANGEFVVSKADYDTLKALSTVNRSDDAEVRFDDFKQAADRGDFSVKEYMFSLEVAMQEDWKKTIAENAYWDRQLELRLYEAGEQTVRIQQDTSLGRDLVDGGKIAFNLFGSLRSAAGALNTLGTLVKVGLSGPLGWVLLGLTTVQTMRAMEQGNKAADGIQGWGDRGFVDIQVSHPDTVKYLKEHYPDIK